MPGLEALLAERAVRLRLEAYADALDQGDHEAFCDCFTADGRFSSRLPDGTPMFGVRGAVELREFALRHTRPPVQVHHHLVTMPRIGEVRDGRVTCRSRLLVLMDLGGVPTVRVFGTYDDVLCLEPDGEWRIAERVATVASMLPDAPPFAYGMPQD